MSYKPFAVSMLSTIAILGAANTIASPVRLDIQSAWPLSLPASGQSAQHFTDQLKQNAGSEIRVKLYSAGKLVPSLEIFDAVQQGSLDAGYTSPLYVAGRFPALQLFGGVPFGPDALSYIDWVYNGGGLEIWRDIYAKQGVVPIPCGIMDSEAGGWYNFEINSTADLKGKKIRFAGLAGEVMKKSGASVVLLSGGDIYPNLERGVIDGTEFSMPAIDQAMGFEKVAKYYYLPGWHQPAAITELIINKRKWDAMSTTQQGLIEQACRDTQLWTVNSTRIDNAKAIAKFKAAGTEIKSFPPKVLAAFKASTEDVMNEQASKNEDFKRTLESLKSYQKETALWNEYKGQ